CLLVAIWGRESLSKTEVNRRLIAGTFVTFASQFALQFGGHLLDLPPMTTTTLHLLLWGALLATYAITIDRRFFFTVGVTWIAFIVAARRQDLVWDMMSAANFTLLLTFLAAWWKPREDVPR